jgi:hypothetical protein
MSLHPIVAALGGDLYQGGRRANVPAPGHSQADRSVSLLLEGDRLVIHGFGAADWRSVRDHLRALGLIDVEGRVTGARPSLAASSTALPDPGVRIEVARRLWASTIPIVEGDLCARHLRRRGIETPPARLGDLRRHPAAPVSVFHDGGPTCPALVAAVRAPDGRLRAVELTYLDPDGQRARRLRLARKTVGLVPAGAAVCLEPPGPVLVVGEGVMTTLSASARFGLPGWALLSAGNLARWSPRRRCARWSLRPIADRRVKRPPRASGADFGRRASRSACACRRILSATGTTPGRRPGKAGRKGEAGRRYGGDRLRRPAGEDPCPVTPGPVSTASRLDPTSPRRSPRHRRPRF